MSFYGDTSLTRLLPRRRFLFEPESSWPEPDPVTDGGGPVPTLPPRAPFEPWPEAGPDPQCDCPAPEMLCIEKKNWWWLAVVAVGVWAWSES